MVVKNRNCFCFLIGLIFFTLQTHGAQKNVTSELPEITLSLPEAPLNTESSENKVDQKRILKQIELRDRH